MDDKEQQKDKTEQRTVANKLIKVRSSTHRLLKIKAAEREKSIGELLDEYANT